MLFSRQALAVLAAVMVVAPAWAKDETDIRTQKTELEKIQKQVSNSRQRLDSLKKAEVSVQKRISEFDQKIASNRKILKRLGDELRQLKSEIGQGEQRLVLSQDVLDFTRRRYLGNIRQFYMATHQPTGLELERPNVELELDRRIVYLAALAGFESESVAEAASYLDEALKNVDQLSGEREKVSKLKKQRETSTALDRTQKSKQEKALERLRRKKAEESDRVVTLQRAAEEMEAIIARLETARQQKQPAKPGAGSAVSVFAALRGQLEAPYRGRIAVPFGNRVDQVTKLKSFSPGISIQGKPGQAVTAVAAGEVAYVGKLRGYGNFVIIDHDGGYFTTYAGLGSVSVGEKQAVAVGAKIAVSGDDGLVRFEIRKGREPLDPVQWVKLDSF